MALAHTVTQNYSYQSLKYRTDKITDKSEIWGMGVWPFSAHTVTQNYSYQSLK